jgi:nuclear transport factor 2 (NTF2) superfamily protein
MSAEQTSGVSWEEAEHLMREAEVAFGTGDVEHILVLFTPDVHVRYADFPVMRGRDEYERFIRARTGRQRNYHPRKTLWAVMGNIVVDSWDGEWEDSASGKVMRGHGVEVLVLRDGKVAQLDAAFNAWEADSAPATPIV